MKYMKAVAKLLPGNILIHSKFLYAVTYDIKADDWFVDIRSPREPLKAKSVSLKGVLVREPSSQKLAGHIMFPFAVKILGEISSDVDFVEDGDEIEVKPFIIREQKTPANQRGTFYRKSITGYKVKNKEGVYV